MYFDAEELAYAEMLAGEVGLDEFTQMCVEEVGRGGGSTPPVSGFKAGSGTPQRRRLFEDSVQNLTPLDLGRLKLGLGKAFDLGAGWEKVKDAAGTFEFVAGAGEKQKQRRGKGESSAKLHEDQIAQLGGGKGVGGAEARGGETG